MTLSDKTTIVATCIAYDSLTVSQKNLVTNLSKLIAAEAALAAMETTLIPVTKDITVVSAFSNATGNTITLKLSSVVDVTYSMQTANFHVIANATDSSHQTIKLTFSSPVLLNASLVSLSLQSGALKTSNNEINNTIHSIPVVTFKKLDLSLDNLFGVDDIVQMLGNPTLQIDVNQDGIFNRDDVLILLGQISVHVR